MIRITAATFACLMALTAAAWGQGPPAATPGARPLAFTVDPSAREEDPLDRQARLLRRMEQSDVHFRHICRSCGLTLPDAAPGASFEPDRALGRR